MTERFTDFYVRDVGAGVLYVPVTYKARAWLDDHAYEEMGNRRFVLDKAESMQLAQAIVADGLTLREG